MVAVAGKSTGSLRREVRGNVKSVPSANARGSWTKTLPWRPADIAAGRERLGKVGQDSRPSHRARMRGGPFAMSTHDPCTAPDCTACPSFSPDRGQIVAQARSGGGGGMKRGGTWSVRLRQPSLGIAARRGLWFSRSRPRPREARQTRYPLHF